MKRSSVIMITILGTVGGLLLAIGLCMCLLPEWNAFTPGVILAAIGAVTLLSIWPIGRRASGKAMIHLTGGYAAAVLLGLAGAAGLGIGLANCLREVTAFGLAVGIVGIVLLLAAVLVGRKAAGKAAVVFHGKQVLAWTIGIAGALVLGVGMCLTTEGGSALLIPGILVGCVGILICILNAVLRLAKGA